VNLIGEHTDYNDGFVLPMAIDRFTAIAADRCASREVTLYSTATGDTARFGLRAPIRRGDPSWSNYLRGVVAGFQERGKRVCGFNAVIDSTLPYGGGLASSAALEVAAATLLEALGRTSLEPLDKALLCQRAEHDYTDVPCGIMDQFTSVLAREGEALLLDCRARTALPVRMSDPDISVLIINTHLRHKLADGEYARRRTQCQAAARALEVPALRDATLAGLEQARTRLDPLVYRRARHVITENERTLMAARAIQACDWPAMGQLMYDSHASLRDDYEVSCRELDAVVEAARDLGVDAGVIGCRMTGAGFGGCAVSLIRTDAALHVTRRLGAAFEKKTGIHATIFASRPAAGARILRPPTASQAGSGRVKSRLKSV
jgi:galactokinase